jgi:hypothetical protein
MACTSKGGYLKSRTRVNACFRSQLLLGEKPENTLVISPANQERGRINALIHRQLQKDGKVSLEDHQMMVYVNRQDMTGTERTFANSYVPDEDIIRYNRVSKVYGFSVGDYARVTATNHEKNEITVQSAKRP